MNLIGRWRRRISKREDSEPGRIAQATAFSIRLFTGILAKFWDEKLHLQSTGLAYTTLLSLIPFLAVTFSVLKGFGVQN